MGNYFRSFTRLILLLAFLVSSAQKKYSIKALTGKGELVIVGDKIKLQPEAFEAFEKMQKAALSEGIDIKIVSGYRSFKRQKKIWNKKYTSYVKKGLSSKEALSKIIAYSTIPGTSRHHWGTDIDIVDIRQKTPKNVLVQSNYEKNGVYEKLKKWMDANAEKFGFYLVYTNNLNRKGFNYEPWHYSYKPLSVNMLKKYLEISFVDLIKSLNIKGNKEIDVKFSTNYYSNNILSINPKLK